MQKRAALYLRSSKDRSDVSIDAQRRELTELAKNRKLIIIEEFSDVLESGKDANRPGFQQLITSLRCPDRKWDTIIMRDTARLSRRRYVAQIFKHECKKRDVEVVFASLPEADAITNVILHAVFEAMDEVHSLMSREKGLAGMAENVNRGYRAGGSAPKGYQLKKIQTSVVRDGRPVEKSVLEPSEDAPLVERYLKARISGMPRNAIQAQLGTNWPQSTLVNLEWNALTYAGHTVWNMRNEFVDGSGYKAGVKRKPRNEWVIKHNTHEALISTEEAETLLKALEKNARQPSRRSPGKYLLSGLLTTPSGTNWHGDGQNFYKVKESCQYRRVHSEDLEEAVVNRVLNDMSSDDFVEEVKRQCELLQDTLPSEDPTAGAKAKLQKLEKKISSMMDLVAEVQHPRPLLEKIDKMEQERLALETDIQQHEIDYLSAKSVQIDGDGIKALLSGALEQLSNGDRENMKNGLFELMDRVELDPTTLDCCIHYNIRLSGGDKMASPRGFEPLLPP